MTHIHWLSIFSPSAPQNLGIRASNAASVRLRTGALIAAQPETFKLSVGPSAPSNSQLIIIGKLGSGTNAKEMGNLWLQQLHVMRPKGTKVVVDFTDDHLLHHSGMSQFYHQALAFIDFAVCSSPLLARNFAKFYSGPIEVIQDPIEIAIVSPKYELQKPSTVLWFGHISNLKYLLNFLPNLSSSRSFRLIVLSNIEALHHMQANQDTIPANVQAQAAIWSVPTMIEAARISDVCIIPSDPSDPRKAGVSANRLLTALALGLPTAADRMDSYLEFSDFFTDIRSPEFHSLLENPLCFTFKIGQIQKIIANDYSLEKIGGKWVDLIKRIILIPPASGQTP